MKSRVVSVFSQGWLAAVIGFLLFNVGQPARKLPTIANITPVSIAAGGPGFALTVTGTNYTSSSVVRWNGNATAPISPRPRPCCGTEPIARPPS